MRVLRVRGVSQNMNSPEPDDLTHKLHTWAVVPRIPPDFQREIWQRLAVRQTTGAEAVWPLFLQAISALMTRPRNVIVSFGVILGLGLSIAHFQALEANARSWKSLENRYVSLVNPLVPR